MDTRGKLEFIPQNYTKINIIGSLVPGLAAEHPNQQAIEYSELELLQLDSLA